MIFGTFSTASKAISLLVWLSILAGSINAGPAGTDIKSLLTQRTRGWDSKTIMSFPYEPSESGERTAFLNATERWTLFDAPTFIAAISPGTQRDVARAIKLATTYNIPFLVTGRRHGYSTSLGALQNGLAIDLSRLDSIHLNANASTVTIGPGVGAGDLFDPLYNAGFEIQTGSASCPSLIGVALGGGVGRFTGTHGLVLDALVSVTMITANGDIIEVSKTSHPDLFWAIRGAGANFGVVTSATFKVTPLSNHGDILTADFVFSSEKSSAYFEMVESLNGNLPAELASMTLAMWNSTMNATVVGANWVYLGPEEEGLKALAPIMELEPDYSSISVVPWNRLVATAGGGVEQTTCEDGVMRDLYSFNIKNYNATTYQSAFEEMVQFHADYPSARGSYVQFEFFPNQAMAAVPKNETSWPWRDATGYINAVMVFGEGDNDVESAASAVGYKLRADLQTTSGYPEPAVFVNYARGDETLEQIFTKENLPRLANLKKTWDPKGFFSYNHGLPTQYP